MRRVGIGYRFELSEWLATRPPEVGSLEITAEHFFDGGDQTLRELTARYPLFVHGLGLSLGTPGPLDAGVLAQFARVAEIAKPEWVSEHVAFTRTADADLGHLNPVSPTYDTLAIIAEHAIEIAERCGRPLILENITSDLRIAGELSETEFLNRLCERARCGLLLDVTNLFINARNHGFDPLPWLYDLEPDSIVQLHIVGYTKRGDRYFDQHGETIQPDLMELLHAVLDYAPVQAITLERDENIDDPTEIVAELRRLETALEEHRPHHGHRVAAE